jgi:predicted transcriptional regulator
MVSVNVPYKSLKSCLDQLAASSLITIDVEEKKRMVSTTQEGMKAVHLYQTAISSLRRNESNAAHRKHGQIPPVRTTR